MARRLILIQYCLLFIGIVPGIAESQGEPVAAMEEAPKIGIAKKSSILCSPRVVDGAEYTMDDGLNVCLQAGATNVVWHKMSSRRAPVDGEIDYSDDALIKAAVSVGLPVNCSLPALTKNPEAACVDEIDGGYVVARGKNFFPDTNTEAFRTEVRDYIKAAKLAGCSSFQQDLGYFMFTRITRGCYGKFARTEETVDETDLSKVQYDRNKVNIIKSWIHDYYDWLKATIEEEYGTKIPLTYNKVLHRNEERSAGNELAKHFDGAIAEVFPEQNNPLSLYNSIHVVNNKTLKLSTATTLRSTNTLEQQRHIAMVYALGGLPIYPWDVFIKIEAPRYYGKAEDYVPYFEVVGQNEELFKGMGLLDYTAVHEGKTLNKHSSGQVVRFADESLQGMAVLRGNAREDRVLHVVNLESQKRPIKLLVPSKYISPGTSHLQVIRPGRPNARATVKRIDSTMVEISLPTLQVWGLVVLK